MDTMTPGHQEGSHGHQDTRKLQDIKKAPRTPGRKKAPTDTMASGTPPQDNLNGSVQAGISYPYCSVMKHMKHMEKFIVGVSEGKWASGLAKSDAQYVIEQMLVYMHLAYSLLRYTILRLMQRFKPCWKTSSIRTISHQSTFSKQSHRVGLGRRYARDDMAKHAHKRSQDDNIQEEIWHSVEHLLKTPAMPE